MQIMFRHHFIPPPLLSNASFMRLFVLTGRAVINSQILILDTFLSNVFIFWLVRVLRTHTNKFSFTESALAIVSWIMAF